MNIIEWTIEYSVGIQLIDNQHKILFGIINDYYNSNLDNEEALIKLLAYIDFHFKTEEMYFEKFNYEEKDKHKMQHDFYEQRIKELESEYLKDRNNMSTKIEIQDFIVNWIKHHILIEDKKYSDCFIKNGL